jgi:hypothetical protein
VQITEFANTGIVHQNINSTIGGNGRIHQSRHIFFLRNIAGHSQRLPTLACNLGHHFC